MLMNDPPRIAEPGAVATRVNLTENQSNRREFAG
jgi:hypothetical protein